jgi:pimeloyl-ACP methyl ester carboxylesterase
MLQLKGVFCRGGSGRTRPRYGQLLREILASASYFPPRPDPARMPPGNGHVVLVIPAFLVGDSFTAPLRKFLAACGYRVEGWELGVNWGPTPAAMRGLRRRFAALVAEEGGPITVIGVSLGGLMARYLAYERPADVRQVITLVSPYNLPTRSTVEPLVRLCAPFYSSGVDIARLAEPLPVPATALYTREDAIVSWESCRDSQESCTAIDVGGPHILVCRNGKALAAVAERIAQAQK